MHYNDLSNINTSQTADVKASAQYDVYNKTGYRGNCVFSIGSTEQTVKVTQNANSAGSTTRLVNVTVQRFTEQSILKVCAYQNSGSKIDVVAGSAVYALEV